jgi:hypothetical protein
MGQIDPTNQTKKILKVATHQLLKIATAEL